MSNDVLEARDKLDEALYFLLEMRLNYVDRKRFIYNLNAFMNSARNVTWSLQAQFKNKGKFDTWYKKETEKMDEDPIFDFFNNLRVASVHQRSARHDLSMRIAYVFPKDGKSFQATEIGYSEKKLSNTDITEMKTLRLVLPSETGAFKEIEPAYTLVTDWQFEKAPKGYEGQDILALSIYYYHKLRQLVERAELSFKEWA